MRTYVWSERPELYAQTLKDCVYSAGLSSLVFGGKTDYPLGIWTAAEREALERSDDRPDETGATLADLSVAVSRRYKIILSIASDPLSTMLTKTGIALVVIGLNGNLRPEDLTLDGKQVRRWDPAYTGGHAVCIVPNFGGTNKHLWLDPEAPNKYAGDLVSTTIVTKWAQSDPPRVVKADQYAPKYRLSIAPYATIRSYVLSATGCLTGTQTVTWGAKGSSAPCQAPASKAGCSSGTATVAKVTAGTFAGRWVRIGTGVSVVKTS